MNRIIVENQIEDMSMQQALDFVCQVIDKGRISTSASKKHYCFLTVFSNHLGEELARVHASLNKNSDRFVVTK